MISSVTARDGIRTRGLGLMIFDFDRKIITNIGGKPRVDCAAESNPLVRCGEYFYDFAASAFRGSAIRAPLRANRVGCGDCCTE